MAKFLNTCMDSADWIENISGCRPLDDVISLQKLSELAERLGPAVFENHWDYPLSETEMLATEDHYNESTFTLVRFLNSNNYGGYEYRWCEV